MKAVVLALSLLCAAAYGQPKITVQSPLPWLQITPANAYPNLAELVTSEFGPAALSRLEQVKAASVVIRNNGPVPITILSLIFKGTGFGTLPRTKNQTYHSFGQKKPLLAVGETKLFYPSDFPPKITQIDVSIDLVVSADNRSAGRDTLQMVKHFQDEQRAVKDLTSDITNRLNNGESAASILARLEQMKARPIVSGKHYDNLQTRTAHDWYAVISRNPQHIREIIDSVQPDQVYPGVSEIKEGSLQ